MAWTSTQLSDLKDAYAQGVLSVTIAGKTLTYTSGADMMKRIKEIEADLGLSTAQKAKRVTYSSFKRT